MMRISLLLLTLISGSQALRTEPIDSSDNPGEPLFLTPLIKSGQIDKARSMSQVDQLNGPNITSYTGYLTVNESCGSNMFFWFFPSLNGDKTAPLLLWLQGGPGTSSLFGLFNEHGPVYVDENGKLQKRNITWNEKYSMVYIDNPVGTGFSFTGKDECYARNEDDVANDLYSALTQFLTLFPEQQPNDFYATGESYAGKYVPAIAYKIHNENQNTPSVKINLKGVIIGNGLCDPESMFPAYAPFLYNIGLLDENQRDYFAARVDKTIQHIREKNFANAFHTINLLIVGVSLQVKPWFYNQTELYYYNYLRATQPKEVYYYEYFLAQTDVRKSIHVGRLSYSYNSKVIKMLTNDLMDTIKPRLTTLLNADYKVLMYNGMLDIIVALPLTQAFLQTVPWKGLEGYKKAKREIWKLNESDVDVAGYIRVYDNLVQVGVRGGGHILPYDQPARAWQMVDSFIQRRQVHGGIVRASAPSFLVDGIYFCFPAFLLNLFVAQQGL